MRLRTTGWADKKIRYILENNLTDHESKSEFVRAAVAKEIRSVLEASKR